MVCIVTAFDMTMKALLIMAPCIGCVLLVGVLNELCKRETRFILLSLAGVLLQCWKELHNHADG